MLRATRRFNPADPQAVIDDWARQHPLGRIGAGRGGSCHRLPAVGRGDIRHRATWLVDGGILAAY